MEWYLNLPLLLSSTCCFDNLAVEQLEVQRFCTPEEWKELYQGEHSMYINAVDHTFSPSSRSASKTVWDLPIKDYYAQISKT
jgi:hypothetical protein